MQWRDRQVLTMAVPSLRYAILRAKASKERCQLKRQRQEREERPLRQTKDTFVSRHSVAWPKRVQEAPRQLRMPQQIL